MPYIAPRDREEYDSHIETLGALVEAFAEKRAESPAGQLNYIITKLILQSYGPFLHSYHDFNEVIGILECAKLEMYRRHVGPYEDEKIIENGDVKYKP